MIKTQTPQQWFEENVNVEKLRESVIGAVMEAVNYENLEDDTYIALVHDVIGGANGQYIPYYALEYFGYELNTDNIEQYDYESTLWELDTFTSELAEIINEALAIDHVKVDFGYWDADGSYCLMAFMDRYNYVDTEFYEEEEELA
jgi:hypothetical protein